MPSDDIIFTGVDISSGRQPVTFAVLDNNLNVMSLEKLDISRAISFMGEYNNVLLAINFPSVHRGQVIYEDLKKNIIQKGFTPYSKKVDAKQWFETNAQDCFHALLGQDSLPRRTFEGRLQRTLILYEQGLQIDDPMEIFEEITRYKLMQGILPLENIHSSKELDALAAAYLAWMAVNRPGQTVAKGGFVLPGSE